MSEEVKFGLENGSCFFSPRRRLLGKKTSLMAKNTIGYSQCLLVTEPPILTTGTLVTL